MPTRYNKLVFIAKLIARSTCFGHHYVHHQELKSYTDSCCLWYEKHPATQTHKPTPPHQTNDGQTKAPCTTSSNFLYNS